MKRKTTEYYVLYLKENVLIFDVFNYIEELAAETVDFMYEWNIIKNDKVIFNKNIIKSFLKEKIKKDLNKIKKISLEMNCFVFSFYMEKKILNKWSLFFENPFKFINFCKKMCKQELPNFFENKKNTIFFQNISGYFLNIPCLIPTGEDEEFLQNKIKKMKKPIDI